MKTLVKGGKKLRVSSCRGKIKTVIAELDLLCRCDKISEIINIGEKLYCFSVSEIWGCALSLYILTE